jgi:hypothetical protein
MMGHSDLYIVDNSSEEQNVKKYLREWCPISKQMDIATGYLEIGVFLALDTEWQKLDKIRIILGKEMTRRTKEVIDQAVEALMMHNLPNVKCLDKELIGAVLEKVSYKNQNCINKTIELMGKI